MVWFILPRFLRLPDDDIVGNRGVSDLSRCSDFMCFLSRAPRVWIYGLGIGVEYSSLIDFNSYKHFIICFQMEDIPAIHTITLKERVFFFSYEVVIDAGS